jgi:hypothetical protein
MSFYQRRVLPFLVHLAMRQKQLLPFRRRVIGEAEGRILEVGVGSGLAHGAQAQRRYLGSWRISRSLGRGNPDRCR